MGPKHAADRRQDFSLGKGNVHYEGPEGE